MRSGLWQCLFLFTVVVVIGCADQPLDLLDPSPPQTRIVVHLKAVDDLNPDLNNRPSPLIVRLYELKAPGAFSKANFFSLYAKADEVLASVLVKQEELIIKPGEKRNLERTLEPETWYIGLLAAYRELDQSEWRTIIKIIPQTTTPIQMELGRTSMSAQISAGQEKRTNPPLSAS